MGGTLAEDQVAKKPYRNCTAGWLGVVKLDHLGGQVGFGVEPNGTVYLSDTEAILTARAPKDPADNPFVEQEFAFQDETGQRVMKNMRPLVLVEDGEGKVGEDRFVPGISDAPESQDDVPHHIHLPGMSAAARDTAAALAAADDREVPTEPVAATPVPASNGAVPASQAIAATPAAPPAEELDEELDEEQPPSWVDNPDRTLEPQRASLPGTNQAPAGGTDDDPAKTGSPTHTPPQRPVQQPIRASSAVEEESADVATQRVVPSESAGTQTAAGAPSEQGGVEQAAPEERASAAETEETAGVTRTGEETGAADRPAGDAPEGEFAQHEEVGSPDAPSASAESQGDGS